MENHQSKKPSFEVGKNWNNQKMKLKERYTQLTDSDLKFETGKEFEMLTRIETRLDLKLDEVISIMNGIREESLTDGIPGKPF